MYTPHPDDEGTQLLLAALRDYIVSEPGVIAPLAGVAVSYTPEGMLTHDTPLPTILPTVIGDGESALGADIQLVRLIVYVMDRGRGYFTIEKVLNRLRALLNDRDRVAEYFTFPADQPLKILTFKATGTTASASFPQWKCEGRGLYLFVEVTGLPSAH